MRTIKNLKATDGYSLECYFDDGGKRNADIKPYLKSEAFQWLQDINNFKQVRNNQYFVSWKNEEIDLSADTLWHIRKVVN
ncbi:DUF2442 domain-containing protein [Dyadobacter frigoris]|uniref:DUF2442 domain-containing protein n=1 Tax=Dyadobacter frigoris TaxID=2576211 RepID=A0A4V6BID5_9BACT|nr:DUF2442 domain-containing protein [Dyadobacter frigoris]TKT88773.1 DUF2442 domain-containing protein [Dyadobacter frigoris]